MLFQQLKAFLKLLQRNVSLAHAIVSLQIRGRILDGHPAVLNNLPVIFILKIDCCSIGMQLGIEFIVIALLLDGLSVLFVCILHIIGTIGALLQSLIGLFLRNQAFTFKFSAVTAGSYSSISDCKATRCSLVEISYGNSLRKRGWPSR